MNRILSIPVLTLALTMASACAVESAAQSLAIPDSTQTGVALIHLSPPTYPPVARQAHITGDVDLMLAIAQDGTVESAVVVSGSPLLGSAALESAQHARFECRKCSEAINPYRLVYTFQLVDVSSCTPAASNSNYIERDKTYPQIVEAQHRVTITAYSICIIDPASDFRKRRSLKCLYLWRCSY
jgi:TonB family protein